MVSSGDRPRGKPASLGRSSRDPTACPPTAKYAIPCWRASVAAGMPKLRRSSPCDITIGRIERLGRREDASLRPAPLLSGKRHSIRRRTSGTIGPDAVGGVGRRGVTGSARRLARPAISGFRNRHGKTSMRPRSTSRSVYQTNNGFADTMFSIHRLLHLRLRPRRPGGASAFAEVRFLRTLAVRENWENAWSG